MHDICQKFFSSLTQAYQDKISTFNDSKPTSEIPTHSTMSSCCLPYLLRGMITDKAAGNMILAGLCFNPRIVQTYDLPVFEKGIFERWGDDIIKDTGNLDISLESAAAVLQPLIQQEGSAVLEKAAETRRADHNSSSSSTGLSTSATSQGSDGSYTWMEQSQEEPMIADEELNSWVESSPTNSSTSG
ncbi:hypothetical protein ANO14919_013480 [Xylariales sp. No.14919]|nr:hypothetical protein ANO14919_013480 [Xylariales sp. No.14919]